MTDTASDWLDTAQTAKYLHVAPRTLINKRSTGPGPRFSKTGERGRVLYRRSDLDSYIRSGRL